MSARSSTTAPPRPSRSIRLRTIRVVASLVGLGIGPLISADAAADFVWLDNWTINRTGDASGGAYGTAGLTLGASAQIFAADAPGSRTGSVTASRSFRLSGSPGGWELSIDGVGSGSYQAYPRFETTFSSRAWIGESYDRRLGFQSTPGTSNSYNASFAGVFTLADGDYTMNGSMLATAHVSTTSALLPGSFGTTSGTFYLGIRSISPIPVPEPSAACLILLGAASFLVALTGRSYLRS